MAYLGSLERILITLVSSYIGQSKMYKGIVALATSARTTVSLSSFPGLLNRSSGDSGINIKSAEIVLGGPEQVAE